MGINWRTDTEYRFIFLFRWKELMFANFRLDLHNFFNKKRRPFCPLFFLAKFNNSVFSWLSVSFHSFSPSYKFIVILVKGSVSSLDLNYIIHILHIFVKGFLFLFFDFKKTFLLSLNCTAGEVERLRLTTTTIL